MMALFPFLSVASTSRKSRLMLPFIVMISAMLFAAVVRMSSARLKASLAGMGTSAL